MQLWKLSRKKMRERVVGKCELVICWKYCVMLLLSNKSPTNCHCWCLRGDRALFDYCKDEQRTLLTTSYKLLLRKDCPPGAYLLDPKSSSDLERALPRLLRTHGVELSPCKFLTRCVICNGNIKRVMTDEDKRCVFVEHGAPGLVNSKEDMEVFRCDRCGQG